MKERSRLLSEINEASFAVDEAVLFLDTHPGDCQAMSYYQEYRKKREKLMKEYEEQFGPLRNDSVMSEGCFAWLDEPWPWEGGSY